MEVDAGELPTQGSIEPETSPRRSGSPGPPSPDPPSLSPASSGPPSEGHSSPGPPSPLQSASLSTSRQDAEKTSHDILDAPYDADDDDDNGPLSPVVKPVVGSLFDGDDEALPLPRRPFAEVPPPRPSSPHPLSTRILDAFTGDHMMEDALPPERASRRPSARTLEGLHSRFSPLRPAPPPPYDPDLVGFDEPGLEPRLAGPLKIIIPRAAEGAGGSSASSGSTGVADRPRQAVSGSMSEDGPKLWFKP